MALIKAFGPHRPDIAPDAYLADYAVVIGDVQIGPQSSVWYHAVLRGDVGAIRIGARTNIQDHAMLHCTTGRTPTLVGDDVVVGHRAILHGCRVDSEALIGMGAIVLDGAVVPSHCIVAAGALVPENAQLEPGYLYAGVPARKLKALSPQQIAMIRAGAAHYVAGGVAHRDAPRLDDSD
ncbi:MAG: gamma carbonic anhydrase family protein [Bacteroidetes bacterium]|nr:MAG: gamma carbonic anhydrase family protein [Bacteroidota bacterium]